MAFVFYDTETTGTDTTFDQILQFAAILTDDDFHELDRFEIRCRLLPHVIPAPGALLATRPIDPEPRPVGPRPLPLQDPFTGSGDACAIGGRPPILLLVATVASRDVRAMDGSTQAGSNL